MTKTVSTATVELHPSGRGFNVGIGGETFLAQSSAEAVLDALERE